MICIQNVHEISPMVMELTKYTVIKQSLGKFSLYSVYHF